MDPTIPHPSVPPSMPPKKSNAKWWLLGCGGCLVLLAIPLILVVGGFVGVGALGFAVTSVSGMLKDNDAYREGLKRAQESAQVQAALGTPIEAHSLPGGSVNSNNGFQTAELTIPVKGPKGEGIIELKASKPPSGPGEFSLLQVRLSSTGEIIDLRPPQ